LLLRFVPRSRQGRTKSCGKEKALYLWTECVVIRRKGLSIFPYILLPWVSGANVAIYSDIPWEAPIDENGQLLHSSLQIPLGQSLARSKPVAVLLISPHRKIFNPVTSQKRFNDERQPN
jgi:hypothetical protein